jgi:transposase
VTNMLPRDRAEQILADHAAGKSVREIAEAYGHSITTVRTYVNGLRTPGEPAPRADDFAPLNPLPLIRAPRHPDAPVS